jgi:hypothetical protein
MPDSYGTNKRRNNWVVPRSRKLTGPLAIGGDSEKQLEKLSEMTSTLSGSSTLPVQPEAYADWNGSWGINEDLHQVSGASIHLSDYQQQLQQP